MARLFLSGNYVPIEFSCLLLLLLTENEDSPTISRYPEFYISCSKWVEYILPLTRKLKGFYTTAIKEIFCLYLNILYIDSPSATSVITIFLLLTVGIIQTKECIHRTHMLPLTAYFYKKVGHNSRTQKVKT